MPQNPSAPAYDDVDIGAILRAVLGRKALILTLMLAAGIATYLGLQFVTPLYTSQARILIEYDEPAFMRPRSETQGTDKRPLLDQEAVASQVQVLLSRDLAREVVKELQLTESSEFTSLSAPAAFFRQMLMAVGLARPVSPRTLEERALDLFQKRLSVYQVAKSRVIAIDFSSRDPKVAAAVPNALAKAYLTWQRREKLRQTNDASAWLSQQIATLRKKVAEAEAKVEEFRNATGLISGRNNEALDTQQLSELNSQLILAKAARTEAQARAELITKMLKEGGDIASAPDVLRSPLIQRLLEQRVRVRREIAELSATLLPSHPRIRQLRSELADLDRQIRQEAEKIVVALRNEARIAGAREESLRNSLNELKKQAGETSANQIKLRALQREAKANRDLLESYLARLNEANARRDVSAVPAHASIISHAHVEDEPSFPKKGPISALVAIAVGLITVASLIVKELVTVTHFRNVPVPASGAPVAAVSARTEGQAGRSAEGLAAEGRPGEAQEQLPDIQTSIGPRPTVLRPARIARTIPDAVTVFEEKLRDRDAGALIVTSDSGTTGTAGIALAAGRALASRGHSVVLVDFSTTGERVSALSGLPAAPGIAELIARSAGFEDVIFPDSATPLQIIPAGGLDARTFTEMDGASWTRISQVLAEIYDCVILHSSLSAARRLIQLEPARAATLLVDSSSPDPESAAQETARYLSPSDPARIEVVILLPDISSKVQPPRDAQARQPHMALGA
ncbi:MAG: exopolysaccharide transport family protein [Methyloligellaceae bacterium]